MTKIIKKLLIANRGEIACRVIKTARKLGIATVAVYSDADKHALHVTMADEAVHIGEAPVKDSYLRSEVILDAAKKLNVDAIHPGYGFLSENSSFADACEKADIIFVGPPSSAIIAMGSKSAAKSIMEDAGVPLVPGYHGEDQSVDIIKNAAVEMGFPVLLKAAAGGGGKGMRQVHHLDDFDSALAAAKRESLSAFGDDTMLVEKYLTQPRHVEIQVFCDNHGNGVYLFERDCSVQRRHQKVIEEAPAPQMPEDLRKEMGEAAIKAAKAINYAGAGTVEFLLDVDGSFYFMEMNTRLQVEHPVTEMITNEDLVEWQLSVAAGHPLPKKQDELTMHGHAFEARIYAEDADQDFMPATGVLSLLRPPQENKHVRVDTGVIEGDEVTVFYDPMIAKLIVWDEDRDRALLRLQKALRDYHIDGVVTNTKFLYNLACHPAFVGQDLSTTFIEKHHNTLFAEENMLSAQDMAELTPLMGLTVLLDNVEQVKHQQGDPTSPWSIHNDWRANSDHAQNFTVLSGGNTLTFSAKRLDAQLGATWLLSVENSQWVVSGQRDDVMLKATINGHQQNVTVSKSADGFALFTAKHAISFAREEIDLGEESVQEDGNAFVAPMNGTVVTQLVKAGDTVSKGDGVIVIEAMKMEQTLVAPVDGKVTEFYFNAGELVEGGAELLAFEANA